MSKWQPFNDTSILSTPNPIHSSSMSDPARKTYLDDVARTLSNMKNSLGPCDPNGVSSGRSKSEQLRRERKLAAEALDRAESMRLSLDSSTDPKIHQLTHLPSRFLKRSELSASNSDNFLKTESTINESDLSVPANSSTPRESVLSTLEQVMKNPASQLRGQSLSRLGSSLMDGSCDLSDALKKFRNTMEFESFCSGIEAVEKIEQDELSWKKEKYIPAEFKDFSVSQNGDSKMSMGSFFKGRSDDISKILTKADSPEKVQPPVPLIELGNSVSSQQDESLSISAIAQILSDAEQTPSKALDYFMKPKKKIEIDEIPRFKEDTYRKSPTPLELLEKEPRKSSIKSVNFKASMSVTFEKSPNDTNNLEGRKENVSPNFHQDNSSLSSRPSSALSSLPDGKLPIATTKTEIVWDCIKLGKNSIQNFVIKNKSASRIGIQCAVSNLAFRLIKEGSDNFLNNLKVVLQPYESRTVTVSFAPNTVGAAVDLLNFTPMDTNQKQTSKQFIKLFGYGGHEYIIFKDIIKDTSGKCLLPLGNIDYQETLKKKFIVRNNGTLPSFTCIGFVSSGLHLFVNVKVTPTTLVLLPEEEKEIVVTYEPRKEDLNFMQSKYNCYVIDIGKLTIIHGTEVNRGRLRKLCKKSVEMGLKISPSTDNLIVKYPNEVMPNDLKLLKESVASVERILQFMDTQEVIVTMEQDPNKSVVEQLQDETAMFQSLCQNTVLENTVRSDGCTIEPSKIILTPPEKSSDCILVTNGTNRKVYFEVSSSPDGLKLKPREGIIEAGETSVVQLSYTRSCVKSNFKVKVLVDNEAFDVDVKVVFIRGSAR